MSGQEARSAAKLQERIDTLLDEGLTTDEILARLEADETRSASRIAELEREVEYLRVRMLVAASFMDSDTYDKFIEHTAGIDAKHKEASRV